MKKKPKESAGFAISRTAHVIHASTRTMMKEIGWELSPEETHALLALASAEEPLAMGAFAARMLRDPTTLKRQLDSLVASKLISRTTSKTDARSVMVALTKRGRTYVDQIEPQIAAQRAQALTGVSKQDIDTMIRVLKKIQVNLSDD